MEWIAHLPASQEAERLLSLPELQPIDRDPALPALLSLLQWALEETQGPMKNRALATWEELMQLDLKGRPRAAVLALLQGNDPEHEVPAGLRHATTPTQAAVGILSLAG